MFDSVPTAFNSERAEFNSTEIELNVTKGIIKVNSEESAGQA